MARLLSTYRDARRAIAKLRLRMKVGTGTVGQNMPPAPNLKNQKPANVWRAPVKPLKTYPSTNVPGSIRRMRQRERLHQSNT